MACMEVQPTTFAVTWKKLSVFKVSNGFIEDSDCNTSSR